MQILLPFKTMQLSHCTSYWALQQSTQSHSVATRPHTPGWSVQTVQYMCTMWSLAMTAPMRIEILSEQLVLKLQSPKSCFSASPQNTNQACSILLGNRGSLHAACMSCQVSRSLPQTWSTPAWPWTTGITRKTLVYSWPDQQATVGYWELQLMDKVSMQWRLHRSTPFCLCTATD